MRLILGLVIGLFAGMASADPSTPSVPSKCSKYEFSEYQKDILKHSYAFGSEFGFGNSLAAIALHESMAGKYLINWSDPSFGVHHILLKTGANIAEVKGHYNKILLGQEIMEDPELSATMAINVLKSAAAVRKRDGTYSWRNVWATYNGGRYYDGSQAQGYARQIAEKILWLNSCFFTPDMKRNLEAIGLNYKIKSVVNPHVVFGDEEFGHLAQK